MWVAWSERRGGWPGCAWWRCATEGAEAEPCTYHVDGDEYIFDKWVAENGVTEDVEHVVSVVG